MNVLHVISSLEVQAGGPQIALAGLVAAQVRAGADVQILSAQRDAAVASYVDRLRCDGARVTLVGPVRGPLGSHPDLRSLTADRVAQADVVHIHGLWEQIIHQAAVAARKAGKPYIIAPHGMLDPWSLSQKWLKKRLYLHWRLRNDLNRASALHFITAGERDLVAPLRLAAPAIVEPIGLDWSEFDVMPPAGSFRAKHPVLQGRPLLLFLGRIHYKKGLDFLVKALGLLKEKRAMLAIAGPDAEGYRASVEKMIDEAGVADRVLFTGMLMGADRIAAMADADLFVLPSRQENFGVVVAESLAAGTPVILSDRVNLHPEITAAGVGAVAPLDAPGLAEVLDRWLADPALRRDASQRSSAFVRSRFDWPRIAQSWKARYEALAASGAATETNQVALAAETQHAH